LIYYLRKIQYIKKIDPVELDISGAGKKITQLSHIRPSVKILRCNDTDISELPELPEGLEEIWASNTKLKILPELPSTLKILRCENCELRGLPKLPNSLIHLIVSGNDLQHLQSLPDGLEILVCNNNILSRLPALPTKKFIRLDCFLNRFTVLPILPNTLQYLSTDPEVRIDTVPAGLKEYKAWRNGILFDIDYSGLNKS